MCDYGSDTTLDLMWIPIRNSILTFVPTEPSLQMQIFRRCPFKVPTYVHKGAVCNMMGLTFAAYRGISNAASRVLLPFMTEDGLFVANFMPKWAWEIISPTVRCVKRINPIIPRPSRFQKERGQRRRRQHLPCRRGSVPIGAQWYPHTVAPSATSSELLSFPLMMLFIFAAAQLLMVVISIPFVSHYFHPYIH